MEYAYSALNYEGKKAIADEDEDYVYVRGIASTPTPDRSKDIVEPKGAVFKTPMPFLWMHSDREPIGEITLAKPDKEGIPFEARMPKIKEPGLVKDRVDMAIMSIRYGLAKAVSIGFRALDWEWMDDGGIHFKSWEWMELSLVTIPANPEAVLDAAKSLDRVNRAALGIKETSVDDYLADKSPGVTGRRPILLIPRG